MPSLANRPAAAAPPRQAGRLLDLDRAKGLAILLVVFGHLVAREEPEGLTWYEPLRIAVYLFHMPFFMYLSGYVTFWSGAARVRPAGWPTLVRRRAVRLLVPFFAFGIAILAAKLVAARLTTVDNVPPGLGAGLRDLVWNTAHSPATSIWYIGCLFVYVVITPVLLWSGRPGPLLLLGLAALLYIPAAPPVLYLDRVCTYFLFFVAGGLAADAGGAWLRLVDLWRWPALAALLFVVWYVGSGQVTFTWTEGVQQWPYKWYMLTAGLLSMPALHGLVRMRGASSFGALEWFGRYCFVIYLLNTVCIGLVKGLLVKVLPWNAANFPLYAAALMVSGTLLPVVIKRSFLSRVPALDRMTD